MNAPRKGTAGGVLVAVVSAVMAATAVGAATGRRGRNDDAEAWISQALLAFFLALVTGVLTAMVVLRRKHLRPTWAPIPALGAAWSASLALSDVVRSGWTLLVPIPLWGACIATIIWARNAPNTRDLVIRSATLVAMTAAVVVINLVQAG
jgi:hypothetical protein